jgi:hypothetical protein
MLGVGGRSRHLEALGLGVYGGGAQLGGHCVTTIKGLSLCLGASLVHPRKLLVSALSKSPLRDSEPEVPIFPYLMKRVL